MRFTDKLLGEEPLKSIVARRYFPAPEKDLQNVQEAEGAVKDWVMTGYHPIGTCSMGEVVDAKLRVKGVQGLRVCDASVFPNHISGNLVATVYAVAEKTADIIKADHDLGI